MSDPKASERETGGHEAGTVTAELAITFPGVILLCVALLMTGQAVIGEVRCADAARAGARLAARGESVSAVTAEVSRRAPPGAAVGVSRSAGLLRVSVRAPLGGASPRWAGLTVNGSATASVESSPSGPRSASPP